MWAYRGLFLLSVLAVCAFAECPAEWSSYFHTDKCVKGFSDKLTFIDAVEYCEKVGAGKQGTLASVHNAFQNAQIATVVGEANRECSSWIGLYDFDGSSTYSWTDESDFDYQNWAPGYPGEIKEGSVVFLDTTENNRWVSTTGLYDTKCFVCQQNAGQDVPTTLPPTTAQKTTSTAPGPVTTVPFTVPPLLSCAASAKFDVLLVFDGSNTVDPKDYNELVNAFINADIPSQMKVDSRHMQFAVGEYSRSMLWASQNVISDANSLKEALIYTRDYAYDGGAGNNIEDVLEMMVPNWFRPNTVPVLVLFTSVGWDRELGPDGKPRYEDPRGDAWEFRKAGGKILGIGLGPLADDLMLKNLTNGCDIVAKTQTEALSLVPWIISAMCSSEPYCTPSW